MPRLKPETSGDLHPSLWLGLPAASLLMVWLTPLLGYARWKALMMDESGLIENATFALLVPAIVLCFVIFRGRRRLPRGVGVLMLLLGIGAVSLLRRKR